MVFTKYATSLSNYVFKGTSVSLPTTYYLGLSTTTPILTGTSISTCNITEPPSGSGYKRIALSSADLTTVIDGMVSNVSDIEFGEAITDWGVITHAIFFDSVTGGSPCFASPLRVSVDIKAGDIFRIKAGNGSFGFGDV